MKPKKRILFVLLFSMCCTTAFAQQTYQQAINAQKKYWYYHYRLLNDFMLEGNCQGCSIPADERDQNNYWRNPHCPNLSGHSPLYFGEDSKIMGYYLGMLATEYKMLSDNNENTDSTARELYFALETCYRLDAAAETYFGGISTANGFMLRDDIHHGFLKNHWDHFNSGKTSPLIVDSLYSEYAFHNQPSQLTDNGNNNAVGKDDYIYLLTGLSCVVKFVPSGATYNNTNLVNNAKEMISLIVSWMKTNGFKIDLSNQPQGVYFLHIAATVKRLVLE